MVSSCECGSTIGSTNRYVMIYMLAAEIVGPTFCISIYILYDSYLGSKLSGRTNSPPTFDFTTYIYLYEAMIGDMPALWRA
jgi:hypothetical protein